MVAAGVVTLEAFSYLSVLLAIIVGLAITQVLQGYRALLLSRSRIRIYVPTLIWSGLLLIFSAQLWWASYGLRGNADWTFAKFGIILLQTVLLYMMSALVFPDLPQSEGQVDLKEHYYREVGPFFSISVLMLAASVAKDVMITGQLPGLMNLGFHGVFAAMAITALVIRRPRVHELLALANVAFIISYIGFLFARLAR